MADFLDCNRDVVGGRRNRPLAHTTFRQCQHTHLRDGYKAAVPFVALMALPGWLLGGLVSWLFFGWSWALQGSVIVGLAYTLPAFIAWPSLARYYAAIRKLSTELHGE